jgi:hypothetical protein
MIPCPLERVQILSGLLRRAGAGIGAKKEYAQKEVGPLPTRSNGPTPNPARVTEATVGDGNLHMYTLQLPVCIPKRG